MEYLRASVNNLYKLGLETCPEKSRHRLDFVVYVLSTDFLCFSKAKRVYCMQVGVYCEQVFLCYTACCFSVRYITFLYVREEMSFRLYS